MTGNSLMWNEFTKQFWSHHGVWSIFSERAGLLNVSEAQSFNVVLFDPFR